MTKTSLALALVLMGCQQAPTNGTTTDVSNIVGKTFSFSGYFNKPNEFIYVD